MERPAKISYPSTVTGSKTSTEAITTQGQQGHAIINYVLIVIVLLFVRGMLVRVLTTQKIGSRKGRQGST